jgi:protein-disulfide isomerase-like protein with CxxC motif
MALTKEAVEALAKAANMTFDDLDAAIKAEDEKTIEVKTTKAYTEESWKTFEANFKKENYEEGKTAGSEMVIKELKKTAGLDFEGKKQDDFLKNYKTKILSDAKINPDKRVTELQEDLRVMREETIPNITKEKETLAGQISKIRMEKEIIKHIPKKLPEAL